MTATSTPAAAASPAAPATYAPGTCVRITTQVARQGQAYTSCVEGVVVKHESKPTGSWFAHGKNDKLWLDRLTIKKADGEVFVCNLDLLAHVEVLGQ